MLTIPRISVGEAATIINAALVIIQATLALSLIALFALAIPRTNSAISWSVIARRIHSSLWPVILRADSTSSRGETGLRLQLFSALFFLSTALISITGVVTPLGLHDGPLVQSGYSWRDSSYVADRSPIGLSTSPRYKHTFGRICGGFGPMPCPGNGNNGNTSEIAPSVKKIFTSTNHGPFNMQFRRYYAGLAGYNYSMTLSKLSVVQSLLLRNGIFAIEGLVVDMNTEGSGIGFTNHTFPDTPQGGSWSQEILWLEPVTACVNTNLTFDYALAGNLYGDNIQKINLTDHGGFANLTTDYPYINITEQKPNLYDHAYKAAVLSNFYTLLFFGNATHNMTRNDSYIGKNFPLNRNNFTFTLGNMQPVDLKYLHDAKFSSGPSLDISCQGWGGADRANIANLGIHCSLILGIPQRTDSGDPLLPGGNSTWSQSLHACASATRARLQKVHFLVNSTRDLESLSISRENVDRPSVWAVERTDLNISDVDVFWGRVDDIYEHDPSLMTTRSDVLYVPAGSSDAWGVIGAGQPTTVPGNAWKSLYDSLEEDIGDVYAKSDYGLQNKYLSLIHTDPVNGPARILNLIWTSLAANNLVGTNTNTTLYAAGNHVSVSYEWKYGIPALILLVMWLSACLATVVIFIVGRLKLSHLRELLNHTSAGRIATGYSALKVTEAVGDRGDRSTRNKASSVLPIEGGWEKKTLVLPLKEKDPREFSYIPVFSNGRDMQSQVWSPNYTYTLSSQK